MSAIPGAPEISEAVASAIRENPSILRRAMSLFGVTARNPEVWQPVVGASLGAGGVYAAGGDSNEMGAGALAGAALGSPSMRRYVMARNQRVLDDLASGKLRADELPGLRNKRITGLVAAKAGVGLGMYGARKVNSILGNLDQGTAAYAQAAQESAKGLSGQGARLNQTLTQTQNRIQSVGDNLDQMTRGLANKGIPVAGVSRLADQVSSGIDTAHQALSQAGAKATQLFHQLPPGAQTAAPYVAGGAAGLGALGLLYHYLKGQAQPPAKAPSRGSIIRSAKDGPSKPRNQRLKLNINIGAHGKPVLDLTPDTMKALMGTGATEEVPEQVPGVKAAAQKCPDCGGPVGRDGRCPKCAKPVKAVAGGVHPAASMSEVYAKSPTYGF